MSLLVLSNNAIEIKINEEEAICFDRETHAQLDRQTDRRHKLIRLFAVNKWLATSQTPRIKAFEIRCEITCTCKDYHFLT